MIKPLPVLIVTLLMAGSLSACGDASDQPNRLQPPAAAADLPASGTASSDSAIMSLSTASTNGTCTAQIGAAAAQRLVERCQAVSSATHPPCNAENSCDLIQGEIDRACAMYGEGEDKPPECTA
ncbi:hypothetical protein [Asticcacaulis sp. EMRT-3]|uniref:hypothetical protein n=1 Tax=Asticcacaulis sp. EMRT-3 TaxID=3040349 RepID=UPI0024AF1428|nr:hypothetical protein [Asticcacaulis sp. EMRT-3]MDI7774658.1 hypothetical protein [Asticcacaulis sp. EMRT-3]